MKSSRINAAAALLNGYCLSDASDGGCTTGYDNDGSTGYEIHENGIALGIAAAKHGITSSDDIWEYHRDGSCDFFLGTEDEIVAKLTKLAKDPDNLKGEDDEDEDDGED